jgi:hypothetical protein
LLFLLTGSLLIAVFHTLLAGNAVQLVPGRSTARRTAGAAAARPGRGDAVAVPLTANESAPNGTTATSAIRAVIVRSMT